MSRLILAIALLGACAIVGLVLWLTRHRPAHRKPKRKTTAVPGPDLDEQLMGHRFDEWPDETPVRDLPPVPARPVWDAPGGNGTWAPRAETPPEVMRQPGADSHTRTDASAPGWPGAGREADFSSHRSPGTDDTTRYLADAGALVEELAEIRRDVTARLQVVAGVKCCSDDRTCYCRAGCQCSCPGCVCDDYGTWQEPMAELAPEVLDKQNTEPLPPALASVPLGGETPVYVGVAEEITGEHDPQCPCGACEAGPDGTRTRNDRSQASPLARLAQPHGALPAELPALLDDDATAGDSDIQPDPYIDSIAEEHVQEYEPEPQPDFDDPALDDWETWEDAPPLLALPAAPECSCVMGHEPLHATTTIAQCPVHRDDDEPPDLAELSYRQALAYVVGVAELEAHAADDALAYAAETGYPQSADPVWAACSGPWLLLENEAERLELAR